MGQEIIPNGQDYALVMTEKPPGGGGSFFYLDFCKVRVYKVLFVLDETVEDLTVQVP